MLYAQLTVKIDISLENVPLKTFFTVIEKKTDYTFMYKNIDLNQLVTIQSKQSSLEEILDRVLTPVNLSFETIDKRILVKKKENILKENTSRTKIVTGIVLDMEENPLIGVSVIVKHSTKGSVTGLDGKFSMMVPENSILVFSYVGYVTKEIPFNEKTSLKIHLEEDLKILDEVVVIGYGTVKKRDLTGALSSIKSKDISMVPVTSTAQALQGRMPGVLVSTSDNAPGAAPAVLIRGKRSINASNDPLYVVDGIPITGAFSEIPPGDIESIDVLKDASATAIYGARGANGVILITTKRGIEGKTQVDYNGYFGLQTIQNKLELMNGGEYAAYVRESYRASGLYTSDKPDKDLDYTIIPAFGGNSKDLHGEPTDAFTWQSIAMAYDANGNYDASKVRSSSLWWDEVERTGMITDHQLSVRGGNTKTKYLFGVNYHKNQGIYKDEDYQRYSIRLNLDHTVNNWLKIGTQTQFSHSLTNRGAGLENNWKVTPLGRYYDDQGNLLQMVSGAEIQWWNPLQYLVEGAVVREKKINRYLGSYYGEIELPLEGLRFRTNIGIDFISTQNYDFTSANARMGGLNYAKNATAQQYVYTIENLLFYDKTVANHFFSATLLQSIQKDLTDSNGIPVEALPSDDLLYYDVGSALTPGTLESNHKVWSLASYMGRLNYNFKNRYYVTASMRYDGSSRLATGHKWVVFPAGALAWRMNEESFLRGWRPLDNLKLRVGYGMTANSAIDPYQTKGQLSKIYYNFGSNNVIGYAPNILPNKSLTWEKTEQWNAGIDFGFFNSRISGTLEFYLQNTKDLLLKRQLPIVSGFSDVMSNVGKTRNKGIELNLTTQNVKSKNFSWTTHWIFNTNKEEIVELYNGKQDDVGSSWFIGKPVDIYYNYKKIGIWQNTPEDQAEMAKFNSNGAAFSIGSIKLLDVDGDYKITAEKDRIILGQRRPKFIGSIINTFNYRDFDLSIFLYGTAGGMLYNPIRYGHQAYRNNNVRYDYWTPENPTNKYPRPNASKDTEYEYTLYYEKSDFLRVKTITLGYTLPKTWASKACLSNCRLYVTAQNPFVWTHYSGIDPEGITGYAGPSVSSWIVGANLSF